MTITLESKDPQTGNASGSGASGPQLSAEKQAILEAKQRKREENERRQRENLEKRKQAQAKFISQKRE